jgi:hypothetical protein
MSVDPLAADKAVQGPGNGRDPLAILARVADEDLARCGRGDRGIGRTRRHPVAPMPGLGASPSSHQRWCVGRGPLTAFREPAPLSPRILPAAPGTNKDRTVAPHANDRSAERSHCSEARHVARFGLIGRRSFGPIGFGVVGPEMVDRRRSPMRRRRRSRGRLTIVVASVRRSSAPLRGDPRSALSKVDYP